MKKLSWVRGWVVGLGLFAGMLGVAPAGAADPPRKLNVLFIAVDDLNVQLGCYGRPVKTPNIDRLASMGRRFDRAYCQYPLCNPSRTSLLSGWRPEHTQVWGNEVAPRPHLAGATPLQEHFHANGYFTARVGKIYHSAFERQFQWDNVEGNPAPAPTAASPATTPAEQRPQRQPRAAGQPRQRARAQAGARGQARAQAPAGARGASGGGPMPITWRAVDGPDESQPDGRAALRVVDLLERPHDRPFFIAAGFAKPHLSWVAPKKYFDLYPPAEVRLPGGPANDRDDIPAIALVGGRDPTTDDERRQAIAAYRACVSFMDAQVGRLLDAMDRLKLWDNTVVVFFGDNGFQLGEHNLWRKVTLFEEGCRVPLIIVAPGMARPGVPAKGLAEFVDIYPTLVALCGLPNVDGLEGAGLVPMLEDPERRIKTAAFSSVERNGRLATSIRTERFRYTEWPDGSVELYDHDADSNEYTNLARDPKYSADLQRLRESLKAGYKAARVGR